MTSRASPVPARACAYGECSVPIAGRQRYCSARHRQAAYFDQKVRAAAAALVQGRDGGMVPWQELRFDETRIGTANGYKKIVRVTHMPTGETVTVEGNRESMRELRDRATLELEQRVAARLEELRKRVEQGRTPG